MHNTVSLTENSAFKRVYGRGKTLVSPFVILYYHKNRQQTRRLGITASKKYGCAVERNYARRRIKEAYRATELNYPEGYDYVFVVRSKMKDVDFGQLISTVESFGNKITEKISSGSAKTN